MYVKNSPQSSTDNLRISNVHQLKPKEKLSIPFFSCLVPAGFPSTASDYIERDIDLNDWMIKNRLATYIVSVEGNSMTYNIQHGDKLIVDRSLEPRHGDVVIACVDGQTTVKRFLVENGRYYLAADNPEYERIEAGADGDFMIWGVVTFTVRKVR